MNANLFLILQWCLFLVLRCKASCNNTIQITKCTASSTFNRDKQFGCHKTYDGQTLNRWSSSSFDVNPWVQVDFEKEFYVMSIDIFQSYSSSWRFKNIELKLSDGSIIFHMLTNSRGRNHINITSVSRYLVIKEISFYGVKKSAREIADIIVVGCNPADFIWSNRYEDWSECSMPCGNGTRTSSRIIDQVSQYGGKNCSESYIRIEPCFLTSCFPDIWDIVAMSAGLGLVISIVILALFFAREKSCRRSAQPKRVDHILDNHPNRVSQELNPITVAPTKKKVVEDCQVMENPYYGCENAIVDQNSTKRMACTKSENTEIVTVTTNVYYDL